MMRVFWDVADRIVRSTRLPHDVGYDAERAALAAEASARRHAEMIPALTLVEVSS